MRRSGSSNGSRSGAVASVIAIAGLSLFLAGCGSSPQATESSMAGPTNAEWVASAQADTRLTIQVHLAQKVAGPDLEQLALEAAAPQSATSAAGRNQRTMTIEQVAATTGASGQSEATVVSYFASRGLKAEVDGTRTFATIPMSVGQAEAIFGVSLGQYRELSKQCKPGAADASKPSCTFVAPGESAAVKVPGELIPALAQGPAADQIVGFNTRPVVRSTDKVPAPTTTPDPMFDSKNLKSAPWWNRSGAPSGCAGATGGQQPGFSPSQLRTAYGFPNDVAKVKQSVALVEMGSDQGISPASLKTFLDCFQIPAGDQPSVKNVNLATGPPTVWGGESNGDAQTLAAFGAPAIDTIYAVNGNNPGTPSSNFLATLSSATTLNDAKHVPVDIISISYDACESQFSQSYGITMQMAEEVLKKAALAGKTIAVATGDSGSSGCVDNGIGSDTVEVNYPASSQWVTAVGGTRLLLDKNNNIAQTQVWNDSFLFAGTPANPQGQVDGGLPGAGGGGVSGSFPKPKWQVGNGVDAGANRQIPDVSYFADPHPGMSAYVMGSWSTFDGTSMAAPIFAAAVAHYNAKHVGAHLGFANPKLYSAIKSKTVELHDITLGNNILGTLNKADTTYTAAPTRSCCTATKGFDTASGWGSVDVSSMIKHVS